MSFYSKLNMKISSPRLKTGSYQHKTDRLTPDSSQKQTSSDPTAGATMAQFAFLATRVATVRTYLNFFRILQRTRPVKRGGHWLLHSEYEVIMSDPGARVAFNNVTRANNVHNPF
jgi:hypothetical protein